VQADLEQHIYPEKSRAPGKRVRLAFERGGKKKSTKKSTKKRKLQSDEAGNAAADAKGGAEVKTTARCTRSLFGLKNSSKTNTCFMNAWLHCLLSIEPLLQIFSSDCLHICKSSPYAGQLATVFKRLVARARETNDSSVFNPRDIINVVAKLAPRFTGNSHHDSQEFLLFVVWSIITASQLVSRPTNKLMLYDVAKRVAKRLAHFQKLGTYADFDYPGFSCPSIERSMLNGRCCI
jgi:ubiquitin C-terminal hydrolase